MCNNMAFFPNSLSSATGGYFCSVLRILKSLKDHFGGFCISCRNPRTLWRHWRMFLGNLDQDQNFKFQTNSDRKSADSTDRVLSFSGNSCPMSVRCLDFLSAFSLSGYCLDFLTVRILSGVCLSSRTR